MMSRISLIIFISFIGLLISCKLDMKPKQIEREIPIQQFSKIFRSDFQSILDSSNVEGSILILDPIKNKFYSNDFNWADISRLPASTFKIPNSIIALETGVVNYDSTIFKWNREKRYLKLWEQDLNLEKAFHFSCVPCYQEIARTIGSEKMNKYLKKLDYENMIVDSSNIDKFWLEGESKISQFQQIDFIKRLYFSDLPISKNTEHIMKKLMIISQNDKYTLRAKTGWVIRNGINNGWFVGYIETGGNIYFFATNISPKENFDMNLFSVIRKDITIKAFNSMNIIQ